MTSPFRAWRFAEFELDEEGFALRKAGAPVAIQAKPLALLVHLVRNHRRLVSREEIVRAVWPDVIVSEASISTATREVRRALGDDARSPRFVETVRAHGIRFVANVEEVPSSPRAASVGAIGPLSAIAVLPFDDLSQAGDHAWLANGMAEELIQSLGRIEGLRVIARNSSSFLKQNDATLGEIGAQLQVGSVVEGSVQPVGEQLKVVAKWVRVEDEAVIWSGRYRKTLVDVLKVQNVIAVGIVEAIRSELGVRDTHSFLLKQRYQTDDVRAWKLVRRAADLALNMDLEAFANARALARQALEIDPNYAVAYGLIAKHIPILDHRVGDRLIRGDLAAKIDHAKRAFDLDPTSVYAYECFIMQCAWQHDYDTAVRLVEFGIRENPNDCRLPNRAVQIFWQVGDLMAAMEYAQRAVSLDPLLAINQLNLGRSHFYLDELEAARRSLERGVSISMETGQESGPYGNLSTSRLCLAATYHRSGRAQEAFEAMLQAYPQHTEVMRRGHAAGGWQGLNLALGEAWLAYDEPDPIGGPFRRPFNHMQQLFLEAGAVDRVYRCLEEKVRYGALDAGWYGITTPGFLRATLPSDYLRQPRFQELLKRIEDVHEQKTVVFLPGVEFLEGKTQRPSGGRDCVEPIDAGKF